MGHFVAEILGHRFESDLIEKIMIILTETIQNSNLTFFWLNPASQKHQTWSLSDLREILESSSFFSERLENEDCHGDLLGSALVCARLLWCQGHGYIYLRG